MKTKYLMMIAATCIISIAGYFSVTVNKLLHYEVGKKQLLPVETQTAAREANHANSSVPEHAAGRGGRRHQAYYTRGIPFFEYRLVDLGGVGVPPDSLNWGNDYVHNTRAFQLMMRPGEPFIDETDFLTVREQFIHYLYKMKGYGYNGIIINGFLEFINFDSLGSGRDVYRANSDYRKRHAVLRQKFSELFSCADDMNMKIILKTDMITLTDRLKSYFKRRFGGIAVADPHFWQVYASGLDELFTTFPSLAGLMIRIGEAGAVYNLEGWNYYSTLDVKTDKAVKLMLRAFLDVAEQHGKTIFFRTWSVGVGETGDMHINPQTYERVLNDIDSPNLVISTKYGKGDFYSYLPVNPTLKTGKHKRIIEFQARREYEAFNAMPNYLAESYQQTLHDILENNPNIQGLWLWNQEGGPQRAGPMSLYPFYGFWQLIDPDVYAMGKIAINPYQDIQDITAAWIRRHLSTDPATITKLQQVLSQSHDAMKKGLYIKEFAAKQVTLAQYEAPPSIWHWDIVSGSQSAWSITYAICRDNIPRTIEEGFEATDMVRRMQAMLNNIDLSTIHNPYLFNKLKESLAYEENLFDALAWYRKAFLSYYHWLDTNRKSSYLDWQQAYDTFEQKKKDHLATYENHLDFPAYNFFEADIGFTLAKRNRPATWFARFLLLLAPVLLVSGMRGLFRHNRKQFLNALRSVLVPSKNSDPRQCAATGYSLAGIMGLTAFIIAGILCFSLFHSTTFVAWQFSIILFFVSAVTLFPIHASSPDRSHLLYLLLPFFIITIFMTGAISVRGPLHFWYHFFTNPGFRVPFTFLFISFSLSIITYYIWSSRRHFLVRKQYQYGSIVVAVGILLFFHGLIINLIGLERFLTALNNELALLPLGLSKVLGITTHLNIDPHVTLRFASLGGAIFLTAWGTRGVRSIFRNRKKTPAIPETSPVPAAAERTE